jgi:hypothetical protein
MRVVLAAVIVSMLLLPVTLKAQSTLSFPHVLDPVDFPLTGYALINPTAGEAAVTFTLFDSRGTAAASVVLPVPAGGQLARLASELFPGAAVSGWVQARSATSNLRGFWLGGDWLTATDGAEAAVAASELLLPLVTTQTDIELVNPLPSSQAILIRLYGAEGFEISEPHIQLLAAAGYYRVRATSAFPPGDVAVATHAKVTCAVQCAGTARVSNYLSGPSLAVVNGVATGSTIKELIFPHVIQGQLGGLSYSTVISVTNLAPTEQTITLFYTSQNGGEPVEVARDLPPNGTVRELSGGLFGFASAFESGWVRVAAELPVAAVSILVESARRAVTASAGIPAAATDFFLGYVAELDPWATGFALLNPTVFDALVDIYAIRPNGTVIGQKTRFFIPGGTKSSMLTSQWIPQTPTRSANGGFLFVHSTLPLIGVELIFSRDQRVLSQVPSFPLGASERFTPPR